MKRAPAVVAALVVAGLVWAGGNGVGSGGLNGFPSSSVSGTAITPSSVTTDRIQVNFIDAGTVGTSGVVNPAAAGINLNPGSGQTVTNSTRQWGSAAAQDNWLGGLGIPTNKALYLNGTTASALVYFDGTNINVVIPAGGLVASGDTTTPARAAFSVAPQDAQPTGPNGVGDMYVTTAGVLKICTAAGSPGTWVSVGAQ